MSGKLPFYGRWLSYQDYLQSDHWLKLRGEKLAVNPQCERCGGGGEEVHHLTYSSFPDSPLSDLMTLCRACHELAHGKRPKKKRRKGQQHYTLVYPDGRRREVHYNLKDSNQYWILKKQRKSKKPVLFYGYDTIRG